jgi:hypothetical protein
MSARTLKIVAISYAVKSLLIGLTWLAVPDLPERAVATVRDAWEWASTRGPERIQR